MPFFGPETDVVAPPTSAPQPFVGPPEDVTPSFTGPDTDLVSPEAIQQAMHAPGSTFLPSPEQAATLRQHERSRPLTDKVAGAAGAAWDAAKFIGAEIPRLFRGMAGQAAANYTNPSAAFLTPYAQPNMTLPEGFTRGTLDLAELLRRAGRKLEDGPSSIFGYQPDPNSWLGKVFPTDTDEKYHQRITDNLIAQRMRQEIAEGKDTTRFPAESINPAGAELGSYLLDPTIAAPAVSLPTATARALGQSVAKGVSAGSRALEVSGRALNTAAKVPEQLAAKVLPEQMVKLGTAVGAVAGLGGAPTQPATILKGAQAAGAAAEKAGQFGQVLAKTHGDSQFTRLQQIAMSEGSPAWIRGAARNLSRLGVDKAAGFAGDVGASAAKGGAIGAALAAPGAETPEELGQGIGSGVAIGGLAHLALAPTMRGAKRRAAEDGDLLRWYESKSPEEQAAIQALKLDRGAALRVLTAEHLANGVLSPNANVRFQYLPGQAYEAQFGKTRGVQLVQGEVPQLIINADRAKDRTFYHELFHALDGSPELVDYGALTRQLFDLTGDKGEVLSKGLISPDEMKKLSDQYFSRFDEAQRATWEPGKLAFEKDVNSPEGADWRTRMSREVAAEMFANLADETGGNLIKDATSVSRRLLDRMVQAENPLIQKAGKKLAGTPKVESDIFPGLKATPELYAAMRDVVRRKQDLNEKPTFDADSSYDAVEINPAEALRPGGEKIAQRFADNDVFKKNADGSLHFQGGRPVLLTEREIKRVQADRVAEMDAVLSKVADSGEEGIMRKKDNGAWEGRFFSDEQLAALERSVRKDLLTPSMLEKIKQNNELAKRSDGSPVLIFYNAATKAGKGGRKYSSKIRESARVATILSQHISKAGNYYWTTLDITAFSKKLERWARTKKKAFQDFNGKDGFTEAAYKYLENHQNNRPGETGLDADPAKALRMKNRINDFFNIRDKASDALNPDRLSTEGDKDNLIRSFRFDRINRVERAGGDKMPIDYGKQKANFSADSSEKEFVKAAAARIDGKVFEAPDHHSAFFKAMDAGLVSEDDFLGPRHEEGFVTNTGRWLDREEAFELGKRNRQVDFRGENLENFTDPKTGKTWLDAAHLTDPEEKSRAERHQDDTLFSADTKDNHVELTVGGKTYKGLNQDVAIARAIWDGAFSGWDDPKIKELLASSKKPKIGPDNELAMFSNDIPIKYWDGEELPHSVGKGNEIPVVHYSSKNILVVDPRKFGTAFATKHDLRGDNKAFFFVAGSPLGRDAQLFGEGSKNAYAAKIDGARLYDLSAGKPDPLNWGGRINRLEADEVVQQAGYAGILIDTGKDDGRQVVLMFEKVEVAPLDKPAPGTVAPRIGLAPAEPPSGAEIQKMAKAVVDLHTKNGGATFTPVENRARGSDEPAYVVSIYPERSQKTKEAPTQDEISRFIIDNWDLLRDPKNSVGTWHDTDGGLHYLDVSVVIPNRKRAIDLGKQYNQKAVWDLQKMESIDTGGTGETLPNLPPETERALYSADTAERRAPTFYSSLQKVIEQKVQGKAIPAAQLSAILRNPQNGVKAEELKWSGIETWLQQKGGRVTKEEVLEFVRQNEVKVEEVEKGDGWRDTRIAELDKEIDELLKEEPTEEIEESLRLLQQEREDLDGGTDRTETKFSQYQLPGGENYRELLFTLPQAFGKPADLRQLSDGSWRALNEAGTAFFGKTREEALQRFSQQRVGEKGYKSSHWDEPNVVAHVRFNERIDSDGKKVLFVEEVQSDWHQEGRRKGYTQDTAANARREELLREMKRIENEQAADEITATRFAQLSVRKNEIRAEIQKINEEGRPDAVPDAPFKNTWHELAFKRLLRWAAENGFDRLAWTTGEMQAARYDLSKHISRVTLEPALTGDGKEYLAAYDLSGKRVVDKMVTRDELADHIGKEAAEKLVNQPEKEFSADLGEPGAKVKRRELRGLDLKVGGEGMRGFYDKILVDFARKYGKKWGAEVKEVRFKDPDGFETESFQDFINRTGREGAEARYMKERQGRDPGTIQVWGMDVTPAMKKTVLEEGQPMFSPATDRRVSTRVPRAVKKAEDPLTGKLQIGLDVIKRDPNFFRKVAAKLARYPLIGNTKGKKLAEKIDVLIEREVDNLLWLHDQFPAELRGRAKLWYDGARRIVDDWFKTHGYKPEQIAAAIAVTSPQRDWFQNVSIAERILTAEKKYADLEATAEHIDWIKPYDKDGALESEAVGKPFAQLSPLGKAVLLRAHEALHGDSSFKIILPEGEFGEVKKTKKGEPSNIQWGSFDQIAKAFVALSDPEFETISRILGNEHKVRSFYNNIMLPGGPDGDVTVDTHAVAAVLLLPVAGESVEVKEHNFGSPKSKITGASGAYGIHAEAYRKAAAERGLLPREMQSITWEAVRGLFQDTWKTPRNYQLVLRLWKEYAAGTKTIDEVRKAILEAAGGITSPDWVGKPAKGRVQSNPGADEKAPPAPDKGDVPQAGVRGPEVPADR